MLSTDVTTTRRRARAAWSCRVQQHGCVQRRVVVYGCRPRCAILLCSPGVGCSRPCELRRLHVIIPSVWRVRGMVHHSIDAAAEGHAAVLGATRCAIHTFRLSGDSGTDRTTTSFCPPIPILPLRHGKPRVLPGQTGQWSSKGAFDTGRCSMLIIQQVHWLWQWPHGCA